jgi:uncharacterized protein involved in exopolysaccharide biosynthesis
LARFTKRIVLFSCSKEQIAGSRASAFYFVTPPIFISRAQVLVKTTNGDRDVAITSLPEMAQQLLQSERI